MRAEIFDGNSVAATAGVKKACNGIYWNPDPSDELKERFPWADFFAMGFYDGLEQRLAERKDPFDPSRPCGRYIPPEAFETDDGVKRCAIWNNTTIIANEAVYKLHAHQWEWVTPSDEIKARYPWAHRVRHHFTDLAGSRERGERPFANDGHPVERGYFDPAWFDEPAGEEKKTPGTWVSVVPGGAVHVGSPVYYDATKGYIVGTAVSDSTTQEGEDKMSTVKITEVQFDKAIADMDADFRAAETMEGALAVFKKYGLPYTVSQAPTLAPQTRMGDFTQKVEGAVVTRTTAGDEVQYAVIPDGASTRDYWVRVGV